MGPLGVQLEVCVTCRQWTELVASGGGQGGVPAYILEALGRNALPLVEGIIFDAGTFIVQTDESTCCTTLQRPTTPALCRGPRALS
mgnify:CR=1 FL=1